MFSFFTDQQFDRITRCSLSLTAKMKKCFAIKTEKPKNRENGRLINAF